MRNLAEKQRRNKLNTCINELSQLVPLISNSSKKIEKTSVLRLSAAYLRLSRRKCIQKYCFIFGILIKNNLTEYYFYYIFSIIGTQRKARTIASIHK